LTDGTIKFYLSRKHGFERKSIPKELIEFERDLQKLKKSIKGRWKDKEYRKERRKIVELQRIGMKND